MSIIIAFIIASVSDTLVLTPGSVDSLLYKSNAIKAQGYSKSITANEFYKSLFGLLLQPEIDFTKTRIDNNPATYNESGEISVSLFSPAKLSLFSRNFFAYKEGRITYQKLYMSKYLDAINTLFDYEYQSQKLRQDSLGMKYAERMYEITLSRVELGLSDSIDLLKAKDNMESQKLLYLEDKNQMREDEQKLRDVLQISSPFKVDIKSFRVDLNGFVDYTRGYDLKMAREQKKSANTGRLLSLLALAPEVGITYKRSYTGTSFERDFDNFNHTRTFGIYLMFHPLDFLFNVRSAELQYKENVYNLKQKELDERRAFVNLNANIKLLKERMDILATRMVLREKSFTLTLEKYSQGELSLTDVVKEQADYMGVMSEYMKNKLDLIRLEFNLYLNYGGKK